MTDTDDGFIHGGGSEGVTKESSSARRARIDAEVARIQLKLTTETPADLYVLHYAAQQALMWAREPDGYRSPFETIEAGAVMSLPNSAPPSAPAVA